MSKALSKLAKRKEQLESQLQAADARLKSERRKADARRKILWGAAVLTMIEKVGGEKTPDGRTRKEVLESGLLKYMSQKDRDFVKSFDE